MISLNSILKIECILYHHSPYFTKKRTDNQRGDGVFEDSVTALKMLNDIGYGQDNSDLILDLVYNPSRGFSCPVLKLNWRVNLRNSSKVVWYCLYSLYAITNLPISRFLEYLIESGNYIDYMQELSNAFNPGTLEGLMCRNTLSISWDGYIYDCDFNQMLDLKSAIEKPHIDSFNIDALMNRQIVTNQHCYGCTAGAGSSCGGEIA